jgi:phosphoribosylamine--glycine ligase
MVIEFNCRFGDPETQAILPSLDAPLLPLLLAASRLGGLKGYSTTVATRQYAVTTVVAAAFYPDRPRVGDAVVLPSLEQGQIVFQAGTAASDRGLVTAGGRVLAITGLGATVQEAKAKSLAGAERVRFEGKQFRRDIAWRELARGAGAS